MTATRIEQDSLGPVNVPADKLWIARFRSMCSPPVSRS